MALVIDRASFETGGLSLILQLAEEKMKAEWQTWMGDHAKMIVLSAACGKTKRVTASGTSDVKNDICLYTLIEADSHEGAAKIFENHPHLQIPQATIDVMPVRKIRVQNDTIFRNS